nr:hypothetical protein [Aeromicrobium sp.]
MLPTLRTVDDLTPEAVTSLMQAHFPGTDIATATATTVHQGTSTHVHLDLTYAGDRPAGAPDRVFVKTQLTTVDDLPEGFTEALGDGGTAVSMLLA